MIDELIKPSKPGSLNVEVEVLPVLHFRSDKTRAQLLLPAEHHPLALRHEAWPLY